MSTSTTEKTRWRRERALCPTVSCGPGKTEQAHADTCDINKILADYTRTGFIKHAKEHQGQYDDVTSMDYQEAMFTVANVKSMFEGLPAQVRKEFGHDAGQFLNYVQDPSNAKVLEQRGILKGNDGIDITGALVPSPTPATQNPSGATEVSSGGSEGSTSESASAGSTGATEGA